MADYKVGAISSLLGDNETKANQITNLFAADLQQKFQRTAVPLEFEIQKKVPVVVEESNDKKKKKRKRDSEVEDAVIEQTTTPEISEQNDEEFDVSKIVSAEKNNRTIFVGNVPLSYSSALLMKHFQKYGEVESIRMRSVPIAGTAVDEVGNQNLVKKVCANAKLFGDQKGSYNAYIVFKSPECVANALQANNDMIETRHIRVDKAIPTLFDTKRTVFIGSISHYTDEEKLREHFSKVSLINVVVRCIILYNPHRGYT